MKVVFKKLLLILDFVNNFKKLSLEFLLKINK
jgi:hypothetical protein